MKKNIGFFIIMILLIIIFPFILENIIYCEDIFPFNKTIRISRENWFSFIGSYIGAIGTIILGIIALYQNKRYKELSDSSEEKLLSLQKEIKTLTEKSAYLIELNTKIEEAKYHPLLINQNYSCWNIDQNSIKENFDLENEVFQISHRSNGACDYILSINDAFKKYHTFVYTLKNSGDKTIRNFNCKSIITNNNHREMGGWIYQSCDIEPGVLLRCVYATSQNLFEQCNNGEIKTLSFQYEMENAIGEQFTMTADFNFYPNVSNTSPIFEMKLSPIEKYNSFTGVSQGLEGLEVSGVSEYSVNNTRLL